MRAWSRLSTFLRELKRRKVYRVTAVYVVLAVGGLELLDLLIPATTLPPWASPLLLGLAIVGLPVVVVLAWTFDVTPSGVVRTADEQELDDEGGTAAGDEDEGGPQSALDPMAVAVLPFDNLSGSANAEPFVTGLHDDLLTELSRASALTVISRTSVRSYRGTEKSMRQIGDELGAGTIVEGGVQKAGDRVRLNVQLIDARTDAHLWAERYDRKLTTETIFDLQAELASSIMTALEARLTKQEEARAHEAPTDDLEAYRLYALGREAFVDRSEEGTRRAADHFQRAIDRDPDYAEAWAGLGMALIALVDYGHVDGPELVERGRRACLEAVELAPALAEAHAAMGNLYGYLHDGPAALEALEKARRLGPGLALGHQWTSWIELCTGNPERALPAAMRATRLDPLEPEARGNLALARLALDDPEGAASEARRLLDARPGFSYGHWILGLARHVMGSPEEGLEEMRRMEESQFRPWTPLSEGLVMVDRADTAGTEALMKSLRDAEAFFHSGVLAASLGDVEQAFHDLAAGHPHFWPSALAIRYWRIEPLNRLRLDARYEDLLGELDREWGVPT